MNNLPTHALSVRQPWADHILFDNKCVENRTWRMPAKWIGVPVYLHAGKQPEPFDHYALPYRSNTKSALERRLGALLGIVEFGKPFTYAEPPHDWHIGPWCWPITHIQPLENPIPYRGQLGFFPVTLPEGV